MSNSLEKLKEKIKGPVFSIITPFKENQSIDFESLGEYLNQIYNAGGRIFFVMAYNSRFSELSWDEIKQLNEFVTKFVKKIDTSNIVIVADPLHCSTDVSIDFCNHAEQIGADLISLIFREKFYSEEQVFQHYLKCSNSTKIGILIHEMPFISGKNGQTTNWPISLLDRISNIKNVIAIKEDAKEDKYTNEVIKCLDNRLAIIISGGGKSQWLRFADRGCQAWLNGIGVFEPKIPIIFYEAFKNKNQEVIDLIIKTIEEPVNKKIFSKYGWHIGIKACLEAKGIFQRYERMPMMPVDDKDMLYVKEEMRKIEISIKKVLN